LRTPISSKTSASRTPSHQALDTTPPTGFRHHNVVTYQPDCEFRSLPPKTYFPPPTYRSINLLTINLFLSLLLASASAIVFPPLPRRPTRTSRTCSIASVSAMPSPTPPQRRHHRTPPFHLALHPRCRARPLLYASSSDPYSTCRRVLPWERAPHLPHQRYPPPVLAPPHSGPLDGFRSAHLSRFGPQNTTLVPSWFDKSDQQVFLLLAILPYMGAFVFRRFPYCYMCPRCPILLYPRVLYVLI